MRVSITVPIYNAEKYLTECLDSIVNQTYKDIEVILVNDGSTDNSVKICESYCAKDKRIKLINKENSGVMETRKIAYENCSGEYIYNVDSDDFIELDAIEKLVNALKESQADIICFGGYVFYGEDKSTKYPIDNYLVGAFEKEEIKNIVLKHSIGGIRNVKSIKNGVCLKIIKTSLVQNNIGYFNKAISMGEDMLISFACFCDANKVVILEEKFYYYRQSEIQSTKKYKQKLILDEENLIERLLTVNADKNADCRNEILRHALETAKATIFNEVKFGKKNNVVKAKIREIFDTNYYKEMMTNFNVKSYSKQEKVLMFLLKRKSVNLLVLLARMVKLIQG